MLIWVSSYVQQKDIIEISLNYNLSYNISVTWIFFTWVGEEKWWDRMGAEGLSNLKDPLIMNSKKY